MHACIHTEITRARDKETLALSFLKGSRSLPQCASVLQKIDKKQQDSSAPVEETERGFTFPVLVVKGRKKTQRGNSEVTAVGEATDKPI